MCVPSIPRYIIKATKSGPPTDATRSRIAKHVEATWKRVRVGIEVVVGEAEAVVCH